VVKPLIAISSCWDYEKKGFNDALRQTWIPEAAKLFDVRFFVGKGQGAETAELPADMVLLPDIDDGYGALTYKTRASLRWAHEREYSNVFRAWPDTYIVPSRLLTCGFANHDYQGDFRNDPKPLHGNYAPGGPGYWLSRKAFSLLIDAPILGVWKDEITVWAEDLWVGQILKNYPDLIYRDDYLRFVNHGSAYFPTRTNEVITSHLSCPYGFRGPAHMHECHQAFLAS
jgi:hypothetical protein